MHLGLQRSEGMIDVLHGFSEGRVHHVTCYAHGEMLHASPPLQGSLGGNDSRCDHEVSHALTVLKCNSCKESTTVANTVCALQLTHQEPVLEGMAYLCHCVTGIQYVWENEPSYFWIVVQVTPKVC
jgi:hypothetical protein